MGRSTRKQAAEAENSSNDEVGKVTKGNLTRSTVDKDATEPKGGSCELEIEIEIFWRDRDSDTSDH